MSEECRIVIVFLVENPDPHVPELHFHRRTWMHLQGDDSFLTGQRGISIIHLTHQLAVDFEHYSAALGDDFIIIPVVSLNLLLQLLARDKLLFRTSTILPVQIAMLPTRNLLRSLRGNRTVLNPPTVWFAFPPSQVLAVESTRTPPPSLRPVQFWPSCCSPDGGRRSF